MQGGAGTNRHPQSSTILYVNIIGWGWKNTPTNISKNTPRPRTCAHFTGAIMPVTGVGKPPVSTSVSMCVWSGRGDHFACVNARWSHTLLSDLSFSNCCRKGKVETCPYTWYNNTLKTSFKICLSVTVVVISILVYLGFGGVQLGQITFVDLENYKRPFLFIQYIKKVKARIGVAARKKAIFFSQAR